jgi:hypothetical protein
MSARTAAFHCPTELVFVSADDIHNTVTFQAASASRANGPWNTIVLDVLTGESLCNCKGAEANRECWHATLVQAAWEGHPARTLAGRYTDEQLVAAGTKAARMCRVYRRRTWRVLPADAVALVACRDEFLRRTRRARAAGRGVAA